MLRFRLGVQTMGTHVWRSAGLQRRGVATGDLKEAMKAMRNKSRRGKKRSPRPRPRYIPLQEPSRQVKEDDLYTLRRMGIHHNADPSQDPSQDPSHDPSHDPFPDGQDQEWLDASFDPIQPTNPVRPFPSSIPHPPLSLPPPPTHPTPSHTPHPTPHTPHPTH